MPSFKIGAGLGRFYGEGMAYLFPSGMNPFVNRSDFPISAGTYALVGSAAFAGANTGAMSSAVIVFEMTGQLTHLLPVIVATLVATITARYFGPSIYDSLIILKKLPYLPSILPSSASGHNVFVDEFMETDLLFVWDKCTYRHVKHLLNAKQQLRLFPFVKSPKSMILLGTVERAELQLLLDTHLSEQQIFNRLQKSQTDLRNLNSQSSLTREMGSRFLVQTISEETADEKLMSEKFLEQEQLNLRVDFSNCPIDPTPFQLMEGTSLIKAHNLFSLLGYFGRCGYTQRGKCA